MSRTGLLSAVLLVALAGVLNASERPSNVVFFLVDDLGWSDLGCYGSQFHESPNIDNFATHAVRFTNAYAACHVCSPTRASIMTGKYPARLGLTDWLTGRKDYPFQKLKNVETIQELPFEETTIAEALKKHGYATAHIGKWHLGEEPSGPLQHGFDIQIPRWNKGWPRAGYHAPFRLDGLIDKPGDYLTDRLTDEAVKFIVEHQDKPFFLYLSHFSVHDPIHGRRDLVPKYEAKRDVVKKSSSSDGSAFILDGNPDDERPLTRHRLDELIKQDNYRDYKVLPQRTVKIKQHQDNAPFAAMIEATDESFGRIIKQLESLKLSANTIVIFFSDNGGMSAGNFGNPARVIDAEQLDKAYSTSNLPLRGGKGWLYEGGIRVPMLVKWPGHSQPGTLCDEPIISVDFLPSIIEMAGVGSELPENVDGVSFAKLFQGHESLERDAIYWHFPHYSNHGMQSPGGAIRAGDYKLLEYFENGTVQLFDLKNDIGEQHDLAMGESKKAAELLEMLHAWRQRVNAKSMEPNPDFAR